MGQGQETASGEEHREGQQLDLPPMQGPRIPPPPAPRRTPQWKELLLPFLTAEGETTLIFTKCRSWPHKRPRIAGPVTQVPIPAKPESRRQRWG